MKFTISALMGLAAVATATDCLTKFDACRNAGDTNSADCAAENAQCKNTCSVALDTCRSSGDPANEAPCQKQYNNCLVNLDFVPTHLDCVSEYDGCRDTNDSLNNTQTCATTNAQCKNACGTVLDTCLTSGDESYKAPCMTIYNSCLVDFTKAATPKSLDCVTKYTNGRDQTDSDSNTLASHNAQCKNACSNIYDTCLSSGDDAQKAPCLKVYDTCLVSFTSEATLSYPDCVTKYMSCDGEDNACSSYNAQCKNACTNMYDTCLSSGDENLRQPCLKQYNQCLVSFPASSTASASATAATSAAATPASCVDQLKSCGLESNVCDANNAQCKNTCVTAYDTCRTSGDPANVAPCLSKYESCLGESYNGTATPTSVATTHIPSSIYSNIGATGGAVTAVAAVVATGASAAVSGSAVRPGAPFGNGTVPEPTVFVTQVVTSFTTYCPAATTLTVGTAKYTVTAATTLTISETVSKTVTSTPAPTAVRPVAEPTVYVTAVTTQYTTYCPAATVVTIGSSAYTVTEATTLVVPQTHTLTVTSTPAVATYTSFVTAEASKAASSASAAVQSVESVVSVKASQHQASLSSVLSTLSYTDKTMPTPAPYFPSNGTAAGSNPGSGSGSGSGAVPSGKAVGTGSAPNPSSSLGVFTGDASKVGAAGLAGVVALVAFAL